MLDSAEKWRGNRLKKPKRVNVEFSLYVKASHKTNIGFPVWKFKQNRKFKIERSFI